MLRFTVLILALVASSFALPHHFHGQYAGDRVRDLMSATADFVRADFSKIDPKRVPIIKWDHMDPVIGANGNLTNVEFQGMSNIITNIVESDPERLFGRIQLIFPEVRLSGYNKIDGIAFGQNVKGEGRLAVSAVNFTFSLNNVQLLETESKALRILSFGLSAETSDYHVVLDGLTVENMTLPAFEEHVDDLLLQYTKPISPALCNYVEADYVASLNAAIGERTLEGVVQWLKNNKEVGVAENIFAQMIAMAKRA